MKNNRLLFIITFLSYCLFAGAADITLKDQGNVTVQSYTDTNVSVEGKTNLFLTGAEPLINSTINLVGDDAWLYFSQIKPSLVTSNWLRYVTIDGQAFDSNKDRIAIYGSGTVIIPNGTKIAQEEALTVYTRRNFGGSSRSFGINTYYNDLEEFDNAILSFKLKKGFAATLANNPDGTGFSRFFIASDEDLEFNEMPEGMEGFVSFIRVFKWEWTAKKGWAGSPSEQLNVSISYDWDAAGDTDNPDTEYVPMRHNLGWQSFEVINANENVSHLLGCNEPDRPDQSDMTIESAITQWPEFFKSGLRLGSPVHSSTPHSWLNGFMAACDSLNYRVDFMVTHAYQYQPTSWWDWYIGAAATDGRPVWVTEWNNGANWTTESWPTASGPQRDANMEIIYDENGNTTTVNRPLDEANAAYSKAKMEQILPHFENIDLLEHHFLYNWVQDARSMELSRVLTPVGEYFAEFNSGVGFKKANEYIHTWKIAPPWLVTSLSDDYTEFNLDWYDHNGETGKSYHLQRKVGDGEFELVKSYTAGVDYNYADTLNFTETIYPITFEEVTYRVYAISYKDTRSIYSREITFKHDDLANPPILSGEAVSATILKLEWSAAANARSYRLERATSANGTYEVVADYFEGEENENKKIEYTDKGLEENTEYYYRISSLNSRGVSSASPVFQLKTKELVTPDAVIDLRAGSGDKVVTLTWDFVYDAVYEILCADSEDGEYEVIDTDVEVAEGDARYKDEVGREYEETYYYKIIPYNAAGVGPESEVVNATPQIAQFLHLSFEEGEGTRVYDNWGGYHADFVNDPTWEIGPDGLPCVALTIAEEAHLQLPAGVVSELEENFTVASWVYLPEDAKNNTRLFDFGDGTEIFMVFIPKYSEGTARYKLMYNDENGNAQMFQPTFAYDFPLGEWAHVAFTVMSYDLGGTFFAAYLNGVRVAYDRDVLGLVPSAMGITPTNYLGRSQWPDDPYCAHKYQDFRIYNQALSMDDVKNLYEGLPLKDLVETATGIKEVVSSYETIVTVAPNPVAANEPVYVTVSNVDLPKNVTLSIYDLMGNCIAQRKLNSPTTTISAPSIPGTYVIKVSSSEFSQGAKLIVK